MNETAADELCNRQARMGYYEPEDINEVRLRPRRFRIVAEEHEIIDVVHDGGRNIGAEEPPKCAY